MAVRATLSVFTPAPSRLLRSIELYSGKVIASRIAITEMTAIISIRLNAPAARGRPGARRGRLVREWGVMAGITPGPGW